MERQIIEIILNSIYATRALRTMIHTLGATGARRGRDRGATGCWQIGYREYIERYLQCKKDSTEWSVYALRRRRALGATLHVDPSLQMHNESEMNANC